MRSKKKIKQIKRNVSRKRMRKNPTPKIGDIQAIKRGLMRRVPLMKSVNGTIFDKEITIDNLTKYTNCIFANGIVVSPTITEIDDLILFKCMINGPIIIPDNITKIGYKSFFECKVCENKLTLGNNIRTISDYAFYNSSFGEKLFIPNSIEYIGVGAFAKCNNVVSIQFDSRCPIQTIHSETFYNCLMVKQIILPYAIINIGEKAFSKCPLLETVENVDNVMHIENEAFSFCFSLNMNVKKILQTAQSVNKTAFYGCRNISSENRPSSNIFSKLFIAQFKFDLNTIPNIKLKTPNSFLYGNFYGESKNQLNINGFSIIENGKDIVIGDYINNNRTDFVFHNEGKTNIRSIIQYDNDMPIVGSCKFQIIYNPVNRFDNFKFEYYGDYYKETIGILTINSKIYIGTWTLSKDNDWFNFRGLVKERSSHQLKIIENGFHSFTKSIFYDDEIQYFNKIDAGNVIIQDIHYSNVAIFQSGTLSGRSQERPLEEDYGRGIAIYSVNKDKLLQYNITNIGLLPSFDMNLSNLISCFSKPIYDNIYFEDISKDSTTDDNLQLIINELNTIYYHIKRTARQILEIFLITYTKFIPVIEKYFEDLARNKTHIELPIHNQLHDILINMQKNIGPTELILENMNSIHGNLTVVKDGPNIFIKQS